MNHPHFLTKYRQTIKASTKQNIIFNIMHNDQNSFCLLFLAEIELGTKCIVEMEKQQTILQNPPSLDKLER